MSYLQSEDHAERAGTTERELRGMIRRMQITLVDGTTWQLVGQRGGSGGDEVREVEAFGMLGFYSTPGAGGEPEAAVGSIGGASSSAILAMRDEKQRAEAAEAAGYASGDAMIYNDSCVCILRAESGKIDIFSRTGTPAPLATMADLQRLRAALATAVIAVGAGGAATVVAAMDAAIGAPPISTAPGQWPIGTTKLRAE